MNPASLLPRDRTDGLFGHDRGKEKVSLKVVRDLVDRKAPHTLADLAQYDDKDWKVHFSVFGRSGLTEPAKRELKKHGGLSVDLEALDKAFR